MTAHKRPESSALRLPWLELVKIVLPIVLSIAAMWVRFETRVTKIEADLALQPSPVVTEARFGVIIAEQKAINIRLDVLQAQIDRLGR